MHNVNILTQLISLIDLVFNDITGGGFAILNSELPDGQTEESLAQAGSVLGLNINEPVKRQICLLLLKFAIMKSNVMTFTIEEVRLSGLLVKISDTVSMKEDIVGMKEDIVNIKEDICC